MPHPTDKLVGTRIRQCRWLKGLTQTQLGEAVGCKFQQIQKYETGANRVSASRLWDITRALDEPITYFFEGEDWPEAAAPPTIDRKTGEILQILLALPEAKRQAILDLARSMAK